MVTRLFRLLVSKNKWNSHCHEYWRRLSNFITCLAEPLDKIVILRLYTLNFQSWEGWTWARVILLFTRRGYKINDNLTTIILKKRKKGFHLLSSEDKKHWPSNNSTPRSKWNTDYFSSVILYPTTYWVWFEVPCGIHANLDFT